MSWLRWLAPVVAGILATLAVAFTESRRAPAQRDSTIELAQLPAGTGPLRIALISDTHLAGPDQTPERLERLIDAVNVQQPDLILLGGDYIGERKFLGCGYSREQSLQPLTRLKARLGVVAVLGNHDYWDDAAAVAGMLQRGGITVLRNEVTRRGPLTIGGIDDDYTGHAKVAHTVNAVAAEGRASLFLTHSPDVFPQLPRGTVLLAGHTHCGQVAIPFVQKFYIPSRFRDRYRCGWYRQQGKVMLVSGGVSTSVIPLRLFAAPEWSLITVVAPS